MIAGQRIISTPPKRPESGIEHHAAATPDGAVVCRAAMAAATALDAAEAMLTTLDNIAGDGDLGTSMVRGAAAVRALPEDAWRNAPSALAAMGHAVRRGSLAVRDHSMPRPCFGPDREIGATPPTPAAWAGAFAAAVASIAELGGAKPGDRTMLDALVPASETFRAAIQQGRSMIEAWQQAIRARGRRHGRHCHHAPSGGRAAYLGERAVGSPDAGAAAVLVWMRSIASAP